MEFKPSRPTTPPKADPPTDGPVRRAPTPPPPTQASPAQPTHANQDTRSFYGFDDIPVESEDMSDVRFTDIFKAWAKRAIKHSPLEKSAEKAGEQRKRLDEIKNDLKWAMQADLDEPVKPRPKLPVQPITPTVDTINQAAPQNPATPQQPKPDSSQTIDININFGSLPKLPSPKKRLSALAAKAKAFKPSKPLIVKTVGALAIVTIGAGAWFFVPGSPGSINSGNSGLASKDAENSPQYTTVLPGGKSAESLGGWHRISPDDRDPVYAYADKINDIAINVSQQPLPSEFKKDTESKVADLAKAYGATSKIESGSDTIHIGTSAEGPQSAILAKNDTLILMKSTSKIPNDAWSEYVKSLR